MRHMAPGIHKLLVTHILQRSSIFFLFLRISKDGHKSATNCYTVCVLLLRSYYRDRATRKALSSYKMKSANSVMFHVKTDELVIMYIQHL